MEGEAKRIIEFGRFIEDDDFTNILCQQKDDLAARTSTGGATEWWKRAGLTGLEGKTIVTNDCCVVNRTRKILINFVYKIQFYTNVYFS